MLCLVLKCPCISTKATLYFSVIEKCEMAIVGKLDLETV